MGGNKSSDIGAVHQLTLEVLSYSITIIPHASEAIHELYMYVNKRNVRVVISVSRASERDTYIEGRKRQPLATSLLDIHTHSHIGILATKKFCFIEHMLKITNYAPIERSHKI